MKAAIFKGQIVAIHSIFTEPNGNIVYRTCEGIKDSFELKIIPLISVNLLIDKGYFICESTKKLLNV